MMTHFVRPALLAVVLAAIAGSASAACRDDLLKTSENLGRTRAGLEGATSAAPAAKCAAYRQHIAALGQVRAVFARCDTGQNKAKNAAQVGASIATFTKQMRESCKN